ncbi:hypothetical protein BH10BAC5_BH10BAC5_09300 [soil metagenome]
MKKLILLFSFILAASPLFSQWSTDPAVNNHVSNGIGNHDNVATCPDGAGGIIMAWANDASGSWKVYVQKINIFGQSVWTSGGIGVCNSPAGQTYPAICTDAAGGALVYWQDHRLGGGFYDFYGQRVNTDGQLMWDANGIKVNNFSCTGTYYQHKCIGAEAGSSIIAWSNGSGAHNGLFSQKLDAFGNRTWDPDDVHISSTQFFNFDLCRDGGKGAYYCFSEPDPGAPSYSNLYAQHLNALGIIQWGPSRTVCDEPYYQSNPSMCEDQNGGFIVAWLDFRSYFYGPVSSMDIYTAHFNSSGINLWGVNGDAVCNNTSDQHSPVCISDLHSGAHIFWTDERFIGPSGVNIFGQNVDYNGVQRWTANGKNVADRVDYTATSNGRYSPQMAGCDALGGAIICWIGYYDIPLTQYGIITQKIDYYGAIQWGANGFIASSGNWKSGPSLIFDGGSGGCNIAWSDARSGNLDIYAQHLKTSGALGNYKPKPVNSGTKDIISQNYPNPFNPTTNIAFTLANDAKVSLAIFDMSGRQLQVLVDGLVTAGDHSVTWNASNYASGTYFYKFTNGNNVEVKKMFLVK